MSTLCPSPALCGFPPALWNLMCAWIQILTQSPTGDVALGKLRELSKPQLPHLWNRTMTAPISWGWYTQEIRLCSYYSLVVSGRLCESERHSRRKATGSIQRCQRTGKTLPLSLTWVLISTVFIYRGVLSLPFSLSPCLSLSLSWAGSRRLTSFSILTPFPQCPHPYLIVCSTGCCTVYSTGT